MTTLAAAAPRAAAKAANSHRAAAWAVAVALGALAVTGIRAEVMEPVRVTSGSMSPTLREGDVVLVSKQDRSPSRGDLITLSSPQDGERVLKRVVGIGGDVVAIQDAILYVNDVRVIEPYVDHESIDALYYGPVTVAEGSVLVLGDSRALSIDSRIYGNISLEDVTGTVIARIWPPRSISSTG
jgi:signal peptidase I